MLTSDVSKVLACASRVIMRMLRLVTILLLLETTHTVKTTDVIHLLEIFVTAMTILPRQAVIIEGLLHLLGTIETIPLRLALQEIMTTSG